MAVKPFEINSIAFPLIGKDYLQPLPGYMPVSELIAQLQVLGVNDVRVGISTGVMARYTDNRVDPTLDFDPSDAEILAFCQQMKGAGFTVTMMPFLNMATTITGSDPGATSDRVQPTNVQEWFSNHRQLIIEKARLAEAAGAERFVVFTDDVQHLLLHPDLTAGWMQLIDEVRAVYHREITAILYADGTIFPGGNNHIQLIPKQIIDKLDLIGLGYFPDPLTTSTSPTVDQLKQAYYSNANGLNSVEFLKGISEFYGKPIWIGDKTFHSFDGSNIKHGRIFGSEPLTVDFQEQADLYELFLSVMAQEQGSWFKGVSFQNYNLIPDYNPNIARFLDSPFGENIQGKPAEEVLRAWFTGQRQTIGPTLSGTAGTDEIEGGYHHDTLRGLEGNDTLFGGTGNNVIDGGAGEDTAIYAGAQSQYTVQKTSTGWLVSSADGTDTLAGVERLRFTDGTLELETSSATSLTFVEVAHRGVLRAPPGVTEANSAGVQIDKGLSQASYVETLIAEAETSTIPALIVPAVVTGFTPTSAGLDSLAVFSALQHSYYTTMGVQNPDLGPYEALGMGFAETPEFRARYGSQTDGAFIATVYEEAFGRSASAPQTIHFQAQIDAFEGLYTGAGVAEDAAAIRARGAVLGQMLGFAATEPNNPYARAAEAFLRDAADGSASYAVDLIGTYQGGSHAVSDLA